VNEVAAESAIAALEDLSSLPAVIQRNADDRQEFINEATGRRLKPIPCHANFAMMNTEVPARGVIDHFKSHNILIGRLFPPMDTFVRISFGLPQEMLEFWRVWDLLGIHPQGHAH
jgi:histidinol-phosphate/aromatic aminotransferase/cobyric acid decarboxylase-like protein